MTTIKKISKWIIYLISLIILYTIFRFLWIEIKYFKPRNIIDKTIKYQEKNIGWTSINHKEKVDEYTRIDSVIYCGEIACNFPPMSDVDIATFEVLPGTRYARDKNNIYYPVSIHCVDFSDCGVCYCVDYIMQGVNRDSFKYLGKDYATDRQNAYFRGELISNADGQTFKIIDGPEFFYFAIDKYRVYEHDKIFENADPFTFYYDKNDERNIDLKFQHKYIIGDKNNKWEFIPPKTINKIK